MVNNEFEIQVQKELEKETEKEKLSQVSELINSEIILNIEKRKQVSEQILYYREKVLEEYRDDEDKVAEYFDHERYVKEESFKLIDRKLKELTVLRNVPYFGRVDFKDLEFMDLETIYIGRFGLTPEESLEPVIIDWRSPVSALFYTGKLGESSYAAPDGNIEVDILKKRQYIIKNRQLEGLFDSELDVKDEILQRVLSSNSGEKLKDIIMTIQQEQDDIIRQPKYGTVVVDGVAGSGKTTIALHRVAYLLYNYRASLQDKVLILGPNNIFMEYISQVLPSLGEVGVNQTTFTKFALGLLEIPRIMDFKDYMEKIIGGDKEFIEEILHKTSSSYIEEIDTFISGVNMEFFESQDVVLEDIKVIGKEEITSLINESYASMPLFRRNKKIRRIIYSKIKDVRNDIFRKIESEYKEALAFKTKEELQLIENEVSFKRKLRIRELVKNIINLKRNMDWLNEKPVEELYEEFNNNKEITIDDLPAMLYLKIKLQGTKYHKEVRHIVIDEAQDYSELQFRVIRELTGCSGYTIVGDRNQRILPAKEELAMNRISHIYKDFGVKEFKLNRSYRSTAEIMNYANRFLKEEKLVPIVRQGDQVEEFFVEEKEKFQEQLIKKIGELKAKNYASIGIICKSLVEVEEINGLLNGKVDMKIFKQDDMLFTEGVMLLPSYFAKGLEFDAAIIIMDDKKDKDDKLRYVMATRALHDLSIFTKR